jgi:hypothetical protein
MTTDAERLAAHQARRGPGKRKVEEPKTYREQLGIDRFNDTHLDGWALAYSTGGSGPTGACRAIQALIEEVRDLRAERLPVAQLKNLPQPMHGSQEDVLYRTAALNIGYLRSDTASKRSEVCDKLAESLDQLARLAALRTEGEAVYLAMTLGWEVTYCPGSSTFTDEANERFRWTVRRSNSFPGPYGCYVTEKGIRDLKRQWNGPVASEVIRQAIWDMAQPDAADERLLRQPKFAYPYAAG